MSEAPVMDEYTRMSTADLSALIIDSLSDVPHPEGEDDCPFCRAVCAVNELVQRVYSGAGAARAGLDYSSARALRALTHERNRLRELLAEYGDRAAAAEAALADAERFIAALAWTLPKRTIWITDTAAREVPANVTLERTDDRASGTIRIRALAGDKP